MKIYLPRLQWRHLNMVQKLPIQSSRLESRKLEDTGRQNPENEQKSN